MNKRGVSPVVTEVLLIMVVLAAFAILISFVVPFVKNSLGKSTECIPYKNYFTFKESFESATGSVSYNCFDGNDLYKMSVEASGEEKLGDEIGGIEIVFTDKEGNSEVAKIEDGKAANCEKKGVRMLNDNGCTRILSIPLNGGAKTYSFNNSKTGFITAEVHPLLKSGSICEKTDSIEIKRCQ